MGEVVKRKEEKSGGRTRRINIEVPPRQDYRGEGKSSRDYLGKVRRLGGCEATAGATPRSHCAQVLSEGST